MGYMGRSCSRSTRSQCRAIFQHDRAAGAIAPLVIVEIIHTVVRGTERRVECQVGGFESAADILAKFQLGGIAEFGKVPALSIMRGIFHKTCHFQFTRQNLGRSRRQEQGQQYTSRNLVGPGFPPPVTSGISHISLHYLCFCNRSLLLTVAEKYAVSIFSTFLHRSHHWTSLSSC